MGSKSPSTVTTTTAPPAGVLANYNDVTNQAKGVAATPYTPYGGELVAGMNQGQSNAIGQLQSAYGVANPYINSGSDYLGSAASGLGDVQNFLQAESQSVAQGQNYAGLAAGLANPGAVQQYMNPYTQSVVNSTMAEARNQDAQQAQQLNSNAIGQGAYGGDRAGIAQASLAGQQDLANNQTIAGLNSANYAQAEQARQADAGLYGNLASSANQSAGLYNSLGQTQGNVSQLYGGLAGQAGNLGQLAQSTAISGASAGLQGSTLQQQNQQQQDTAAYNQWQQGWQYPFQTTGWLANIDEGIGNSSGSLTSSPGPSTASQVLGAATTGLGILGATGALSGLSGMFSDERLKEDIEPIGKTFSGDTMYRFRYKGDPTVRTGLLAQEVERKSPGAVHQVGGFKAVDYGAATDKAAERGRFARGGGLAGIRPAALSDDGETVDRVPGLGSMMMVGRNRDGTRSNFVTSGPGTVNQSTASIKGPDPLDDTAEGRMARYVAQYGVSPNRGVGPGHYRPMSGPGSLQSLRGAFADGGSVLGGDDTLSPGLSFAVPPSWSGAGLSGGLAGAGAAQVPAGGGLSAGGAGGARPGSMGVLSAPPVPQTASTGFGGLGGLSPSSGGSSGGSADTSSGGSGSSNLWNGVIAAGLGTMAGTSPFAMVNLGQGGLAGMKQYQQQQQLDQANAIARGHLGVEQGGLLLDQRKADLAWQSQLMAINAGRAAAGLPPLAGLSGGLASPSSGSAGPITFSPPSDASSGGLGSPAGSTSSLPALPTAAASGPAASSAASGSAAAPASPPATDTGTSFWSGVDPNFNPYTLNNRANAAQAFGDTTAADALRTRASGIVTSGQVPMRDGTIQAIPGFLSRLSQQKSAEAQGEEAGKTQTVYDPDGTPIQVPGTTYQQIVRNGGGQVNGTPVSTGNSPYMKASVDNYTEFSKNAQSFIGDYPQQKYNLDSIAHIFQNYQAWRGAEAIADLDSYSKQAGIEKLLPANWQNSAGGFDAAVKVATTEAFTGLKDSGVTRAPATGLREVMLTTPRPDADPAALYKLVTDKQAALEYGHDVYTDFVNGNEKNPTRSLISFQKAHAYGDYVSSARNATAPFAGMTPAGGRMVLGPTGTPGGSAGPGSQPAAQPQAAPRIPAPPSSVPPGSAYSPSRNMWRSPDGSIFDAQGRRQ